MMITRSVVTQFVEESKESEPSTKALRCRSVRDDRGLRCRAPASPVAANHAANGGVEDVLRLTLGRYTHVRRRATSWSFVIRLLYRPRPSAHLFAL